MLDDAGLSARLGEQQRYYRAVAPEYDEAYGTDGGPLNDAAAALDFIGMAGDTVELACGTGQWSRLIRPRVASLTCVDFSPEMIEQARARAGQEVEFVRADIFEWRPARRFDTVFFAFWLSHVPLARWPSFWASLAGLLAPGGVVGLVDETDSGVADKETWTATPDIAARRLADGREFEIVKLRLDPAEVVASLAELGWQADTLAFHPGIFALRATYRGAD